VTIYTGGGSMHGGGYAHRVRARRRIRGGLLLGARQQHLWLPSIRLEENPDMWAPHGSGTPVHNATTPDVSPTGRPTR
jgi:hypothetical protein